MKMLMVLIATAAVMFGVSFTASYMLRMSKRPATEPEGLVADANKKADGQDEDRAKQAVLITDESKGANKQAGVVEAGETKSSQAKLLRAASEAEEASKLAASLRQRLAAVGEQEAALAAKKNVLDLVYKDIRDERAVIEDLRKEIGLEIKQLDDRLRAIPAEERPDIKEKPPGKKTVDDRKQLETVKKSLEQSAQKKLAAIFKDMDPAAAAKTLRQLVKDGQIEKAALLLAGIPERQAARILEELADPTLAEKLLEQLQKTGRQAK